MPSTTRASQMLSGDVAGLASTSSVSRFSASSSSPKLSEIEQQQFASMMPLANFAKSTPQQTRQLEKPSLARTQTSPQDLAELSSTAAVVAPAAAASSNSISATAQPISTKQVSIEPQRRAQHDEQHHTHATQQHHGEHTRRIVTNQRPILANSPAAPSPMSRTAALLAAAIAKHTERLSAVPPQAVEQLDTTCHCLVVDEARLSKDGVDFNIYTKALQLASDAGADDTLRTHIIEWLGHDLQPVIGVVHVPAKESRKLLHINFTSLEGLARALVQHSFLVRCGSINTSHWNAAACGPKRQACPEVLAFSFIATTAERRDIKHLQSDVASTLALMKIEYTALWFASDAQHGGSKTLNLFKFFILPRNIDAALSAVKHEHLKHRLWGGQIKIHAPNLPAFFRCTQCDKLGHRSEHCDKYKGTPVRIQLKAPASYHAMNQMRELTNARAAFLGSSMDERKPSRRVTLLFDITDQDEKFVDTIAMAVSELVKRLGDSLHKPPYVLTNVSDRLKECRECGDTSGAHECHFFSGPGVAAARPGAPHPAAATSSASSSTAPRPSTTPTANRNTSRAAAQRGGDKMCHQWRHSKTCTREGSCTWEHPPEHVPIVRSSVCHQFQQGQHCDRGTTCPFKHPTVAAPPPPSTPAPAAAAAAAAPSTAPRPPRQTATLPAAPAAATVPNPILQQHASAASTAATPTSSRPQSSPKAKRQRPVGDSPENEEAQARGASGNSEPDRTSRPSSKKAKATASASTTATAAMSSNSFAALDNDTTHDQSDEDEEMEVDGPNAQPPPRTPSRSPPAVSRQGSALAALSAPMSSLGSISSPTKTPSGASTKKKTGAGTARPLSQQ